MRTSLGLDFFGHKNWHVPVTAALGNVILVFYNLFVFLIKKFARDRQTDGQTDGQDN